MDVDEWKQYCLPSASPDYGTFQFLQQQTSREVARKQLSIGLTLPEIFGSSGGFDNNISLKDDVWKYDVTQPMGGWRALQAHMPHRHMEHWEYLLQQIRPGKKCLHGMERFVGKFLAFGGGLLLIKLPIYGSLI
jgi:hypothetical protein